MLNSNIKLIGYHPVKQIELKVNDMDIFKRRYKTFRQITDISNHLNCDIDNFYFSDLDNHEKVFDLKLKAIESIDRLKDKISNMI